MWCGQHLAPSGIQALRVKNTTSRSSEEPTLEPTTRWARHTQHVLRWSSSRTEKQIRFVYSWDDPVAFICKVIVFETDGDGVAESFTVVRPRPLGANVSISYRVCITSFDLRITAIHVAYDTTEFGIFSSPFFVRITTAVAYLGRTCQWFHRTNRHEHSKKRRCQWPHCARSI